MSTESELRDWRNGQTNAERLVADLLHLEGYKKIDPQHPLGGPDGTKDVVFEHQGKKWIAGAYFPTTQVTYSSIREKFLTDFKGVSISKAQGFAFFVNQALTLGERKLLAQLASPVSTEIYHLERIRVLLDSPQGCGLRLRYLRIPMSEEEQWAFWDKLNSSVLDSVVETGHRLRFVESKLDEVLMRTQRYPTPLAEIPSRLSGTDQKPSDIDFGPTSLLTPPLLVWVHSLVSANLGLDPFSRGAFRSVSLWVGKAGTTIEDAKYIAPPPEAVLQLVTKLLKGRTGEYAELVGARPEKILPKLAKFYHQLLAIHPFADANGRLADAILDQAAKELLGINLSEAITVDRKTYYEALEDGDRGDLRALVRLFSGARLRESS